MLIALTVYVVYFRKSRDASPTPIETIPINTLPTTQADAQPTNNPTSETKPIDIYRATSTSFGIVADLPIISYSTPQEGRVDLVLPNGTVLRIENNTTTTLNSAPISNLSAATPSFDGNYILFKFRSGNTSRFSVLNTSTQSWTILPEETTAATWEPKLNSGRLALFTTDSKQISRLVVTDLKNQQNKDQVIITLKAGGLIPYWISGNNIVLTEPESSFVNGSIWLVDINLKTLTPVVQDLPGLMSSWSFYSPWGVMLVADDRQRLASFQIVNILTNESRQVQFSTLPHKCGFADDFSGLEKRNASTIVCAIPSNRADFASKQLDDYLIRAAYSVDVFYLIDAVNGDIMNISIPPGLELDAEKLRLIDRTLFFINRYDQKLYAVKIPSDW